MNSSSTVWVSYCTKAWELRPFVEADVRCFYGFVAIFWVFIWFDVATANALSALPLLAFVKFLFKNLFFYFSYYSYKTSCISLFILQYILLNNLKFILQHHHQTKGNTPTHHQNRHWTKANTPIPTGCNQPPPFTTHYNRNLKFFDFLLSKPKVLLQSTTP